MIKDNIFVSVNDAAVQRDDAGLYHIHIGQQGMTGITLDQLNEMTVALEALLAAEAEREDMDAEG